jgi:hypothetical protein
MRVEIGQIWSFLSVISVSISGVLMLLNVYKTAPAMRSYDIYIPGLSEQRVDLHTEYGTSGKDH